MTTLKGLLVKYLINRSESPAGSNRTLLTAVEEAYNSNRSRNSRRDSDMGLPFLP